MEQEIWKNVPGWENLYQVSSNGRIRSLGFKWSVHQKQLMETLPRILKLPTDKAGYPTVVLYNNPFKRGMRVHRLVAMAFLANPENKKEVNHVNGIKNDNRVENLEWVTRHQNILHAHKLGFRKNASAIAADVKTDYDSGLYTWETIAKKYGISRPTVWRILTGKIFDGKYDNYGT